MLAAPRRNAVQILTGGPGRSPAATTSHRISSAGATAAVPMTVGRDSRTNISIALFQLSFNMASDRSRWLAIELSSAAYVIESEFGRCQARSVPLRWQISHFPALSTSKMRFRPRARGFPLPRMIFCGQRVGERAGDLISRGRNTFKVSPQGDQLAHARNPRHIRD